MRLTGTTAAVMMCAGKGMCMCCCMSCSVKSKLYMGKKTKLEGFMQS